ncbi:hypothetical protein PG993_003180 [Apiospora rasikravindrae]|uniref:Clr5 domain-containing protein n=1 Tax=Apiospora rasikravindrae TaxID=990691 RepID=A0ABR1TYN6_9PEZI
MGMTNTTDEPGMYRDWEGYRSVITRLYSEENRPLKEVVHWMAQEYDFHATYCPSYLVFCSGQKYDTSGLTKPIISSEKMYKDRLKRWGIRKYMKSAHTGDVDLPVKRTLTPRHRDLDPHRVRQFLHQSSFRLRKSAPGRRGAMLTPTQFSPTTLNLRGDLAGMESALQAVTTYTNTCFETGAWDFSPEYFGPLAGHPKPPCRSRPPRGRGRARARLRAVRRASGPHRAGRAAPLAVLWAKLESVEEPQQLQEAVRTMTGAELDTVDRHVVPGSLYPTRSRVMVALALYCNALVDAVSTEAKLQAIYTSMWWYRAHGGADVCGGWIDWSNHPLSQVAIDDIWEECGGDAKRLDEMRKQLPFALRLRHSKRLLSFESWAELEEFARQRRIRAQTKLMEGDYTAMLQDVAYDDAAVNGKNL